MELVYLWVEDYKNIKKQGFNFSPRFECEFKDEYDDEGKLKDNCELIIKEKKDYVSIFPNNINVTAIVGENGSGKSGIYETINNLIEDLKNFKKYKDYFSPITITKNILVFKRNEELYYFSENILITRINRIKDDFSLDIKQVTYSLDNKKIFDSEEIIDENKIKLEENEIAKILTDNLVYNKDFKLSSFMYIPYKIEISNSFEYEKYIDENKEKQIYKEFNDASDVSFEEEKDAEKEMKHNIYNLENYSGDLKNITDDYHQFLIIWFIENHYSNFDLLTNKEGLIEEYDNQEEDEKINEDEFLNPPTKNIDEFTEHEKELYFDKYHNYFRFDFEDSLGRKFSDLSHGERVFFGQFISIYHLISKSEGSSLINFDEPELAIHPNWQKKYINELLNLLEQFDNKIHLILTSHSPFILSDLPKENVIFLEKGKQVYPFEDNQQTFGANIHTLLSHGFFMKDGLMGEFAKDKISQILFLLSGKIGPINIPNEQIKPIINIIGEDFLKEKLLRMYNEKYNIKSKDDEIKELKAEVERLNNAQNKI